MTIKKERFRNAIKRLKFLSEARQSAIQRLGEKFREPGEEAALATALVEQKLLTRWQVDQLIHGISDLSIENYELIDQVGEGGMSIVYKALNLKDNRKYAIKVLSPAMLKSTESVERFRRETALLKKLRHPNLVSALDGDVNRERPFFVMELVGGQNLRSYMTARGKLSIRESCDIAKQICYGLSHAHVHGFSHRDIKPENIMITHALGGKAVHAKILDMGLASVLYGAGENRLTGSGQMLGTADYIAPEQAKNSRTATNRSDIYSVGVVLFEMLTGEFPHTGDKKMDRLSNKMDQPARTLKSLLPLIPEPLNELVAHMLARNPEDRIQNAAEVVSKLNPFVQKSS